MCLKNLEDGKMAKTKKSLVSPKHQSPPNIFVYNSQKKIPLSKLKIKKMIQKLLDHYDLHTTSLAVHFVSKKRSGQLHEQFFNDPSPTDCMSFPIDDPFLEKNGFMGEIVVCPEVAFEYAQNKKIDAYMEISRYLIHGFLHLIGFDDLRPEEKRKMRSKEAAFLKLFKEQGLLPVV